MRIVSAIGLSREEIHTLEILLSPSDYVIARYNQDALDGEAITRIYYEAFCIVMNPKKIFIRHLDQLMKTHLENIKNNCGHIPMLLMTEKLNKYGQICSGIVNLHARIDETRQKAVEILNCVTVPFWQRLKQMESNLFNDGWYFVDIETTGDSPLKDDISKIKIAYMGNFKIQGEKEICIIPGSFISANTAKTTIIGSFLHESKYDLSDALNELVNRSHPAPLILRDEAYISSFLTAAFHMCGMTFDIPYVSLEGLAAIVFGYGLSLKPSEILRIVGHRKNPRTFMTEPGLYEMYDLTLSLFERLQDCYGIRAPGDFPRL